MIASKKHKQTTANGNRNVINGALKLEDNFYAPIDQIETQKVGCCKKVEPVRFSYMVLCESHRRRRALVTQLVCSAGCGIFLYTGQVHLCQQHHFFHRDCAAKFILLEACDPSQPNFTCPTLMLKCPNCGIDATKNESTITTRCNIQHRTCGYARAGEQF